MKNQVIAGKEMEARSVSSSSSARSRAVFRDAGADVSGAQIQFESGSPREEVYVCFQEHFSAKDPMAASFRLASEEKLFGNFSGNVCRLETQVEGGSLDFSSLAPMRLLRSSETKEF